MKKKILKINRKALTRILIITVIFTILSGIFILAEENPQDIAGTYTVTAKNADTLRINGRRIRPCGEADSVNIITIDVSDLDTDKNCVLLNSTVLGYLSNGENSFEFADSLLRDKDNEIRIVPSAGSSAFTEGLVYGEYNLDDLVVNSVSLELGAFGISGSEAIKEIIKYMPVVGKADTVEQHIPYTDSVQIGDGWNSETKLGGTTPQLPIFIGYIFDMPDEEAVCFKIDTTEFEDGVYIIEIFRGDNIVEKRSIRIDNTPPELVLSFKNGETISNNNIIKFEAVDNLPVTLTARINNKEINQNNVSLKSFSEGSHTLHLTASDSLGNTVEGVYEFNVKQTIPDYTLVKKNKSALLSISGDASATIYSAELIDRINMYSNRLGSFSQSALRSSDEVLVSFIEKDKIVTESAGNTLPYQSFVAEIGSNTGDAIISYTGKTGSGEDILLKVWNYEKEQWDTLARTDSGVSISFTVDMGKYSKDGKMRINAYPYILSNGSDTLLWHSDTQYYSRYDDLNQKYFDITNYAKQEYLAGNIGYVVHTGDIIDTSQSGDAIAEKEYSVASRAQAVLDDALVPNGIVSGNHDIKGSAADYSYYFKYFGSKRYENFEWYGGNFKNNTHHYDLITIGSYDFLMLYIGCYDEDSSDTILWANAVLEAYPERNAVICTHEYINSAGLYTGDRAAVIWNEIVVPNENIKMILCGHNEGAANQLRKVEGSDRYVLEILANYQFAELGIEPMHIENGCTCDGEGFVRLMTFNEAGQVISITYSPTADKYNYYPSYVDSFVYDLELIPAQRSIKTTEFLVGVNITEEGVFGRDEINLSKKDSVFAVIDEGNISHTTELLALRYAPVSYSVFADTRNYEIKTEPFSITGMRGVLPSLRRGEQNKKPSEDNVEIAAELMPSQTNKVKRTSGSEDFIPTYMEDGRYNLRYKAAPSATWVTTALDINKTVDFDEYNRLYFGVSTENNTKWNLYLNLSDGTTLNFSQDLYGLFGYEDYYIPSDIQSTWQGYIPLDDYVSGEVMVKSVYFVAATPDSPVTFDYFFIGKSLGKEVLFVTDEETAYSIDALVGERVDAISPPFKNGYIFTGWYEDEDEDEKATQFPKKVGEDGLTVYARFAKKNLESTGGTVFYNEEVDILPGTDYNKLVIIWVIILTVIAGFAAAAFSAIKHKKKLV